MPKQKIYSLQVYSIPTNKCKPIEYDKDESPEGESLRGSLIYTTKIFVDNDIFKGMNKKILEPAFKETQKMPVLIEIRG